MRCCTELFKLFMSATIASVLLVFLVVSLTQPHLLDSRAAKSRHTHLLNSRAVKPRHTHLDSRATKPRLTHLLDSRAATVRCPSSSLTIPYQCWTSTRPLLEVTTCVHRRRKQLKSGGAELMMNLELPASPWNA